MARSSYEAVQSWSDQVTKLGELAMQSVRDVDTHAISLNGEMDLANYDEVEDEFLRVEDGDARFIVIDLSGLTFVDCSAIRMFCAASERARAHGDPDRLWWLRPPEHVHRVLQLAGIDERLQFAD